MLPPCTRVEDTVLDLIQIAPTFDDAYAWICRAIGRRRTTADRIRQAMDARKKMRWRRELDAGARRRRRRRLVRCWNTATSTGWNARTGCPPPAAGEDQAATGNRYLDNLYEETGCASELDGTAAHPADEQWRDKRRDNANAVQGIVTLRFGFSTWAIAGARPRPTSPPSSPARLAGHRPPLLPPSLRPAADIMIVTSLGTICPNWPRS